MGFNPAEFGPGQNKGRRKGRNGPKVDGEKMSRLERVASRVRQIARRVAPKVAKGAKKVAQAGFELGERVTRPAPQVRMMHGRPHIAAAGLPTKREASAVAQEARRVLGTNCRMNQVQGPNGKQWIIWVCDPEDSKRKAQSQRHEGGPFAGEERIFTRRSVESVPTNPGDVFGVPSDMFD